MNWQALTLSFRLGLRKGRGEPLHALGVVVIFLALVASYGQMLKVLPDADMARMGVTHGQLVWYLILTEITIVGTSARFREVQDEVRSGAIEIMLLRPVSFWPMKLAGWTGEQFVRLSLMMPVGLAAGWLLAGFLTAGASLLMLVPSYLAGLAIIHCSYLMCGAACLWVGEARPVFFLFQKLIFLLGGLLWPLAFYPAWLRHLTWGTPFPAMIAVPGEFALTPGGMILTLHLADQLAWLAVFLTLCALTERAMRRRITVEGQS